MITYTVKFNGRTLASGFWNEDSEKILSAYKGSGALLTLYNVPAYFETDKVVL